MADQLRDGDGSDEPGKFVRVATQTESEEVKMEKDRLVFQVLQFYATLLESYPAFLTNESYVDDIRRIGGSYLSQIRYLC